MIALPTSGRATIAWGFNPETGQRVADNSLPHLEAWLGLPAHGRVINDLNTRLAVAERAFMVDDCEAVALIVD
jgi:acyl-CoA synthetase (AMP-forming)/AMP-acid ligase II